jgi:aspartate aminotransferase
MNVKAGNLISMGKDIINLCVGEPEEPTPSFICAAAKASMDNGFTKYTHPTGIPELKQAVCRKLLQENRLDYEPGQIVVSSGAKHCVFNTLLALVNPGDEVVIPAPCWVTYPELVKMLGGVPVMVPTETVSGYKIKPADLSRAVNAKTKVVILNSPSNPTGAVYTEEELKPLADIMVANDLYCLSDEIYEHIIYDGIQHVSIASLSSEMYNRTIVVNGVSKSFAMTGWRIGYSACSTSLAKIIGTVQGQGTLHPANPSQYGAIAALDSGRAFTQKMVTGLLRKKQAVENRLSGMDGVRFIPPHGAFYFFLDLTEILSNPNNSAGIFTSEAFCNWLLEEHLLATVPGIAFGIEGHLRISFTSPLEVLEQGLLRLKKGLKSL